jgi:ubiquinone/menaquinone biosynthesis C-methylase UbiE
MSSINEESNTTVQEIDRIRRAYDLRDRQDFSKIYSYVNPAFLFHMQERERAILTLLRKKKIDLSQSSILEVGCGTGHILQRFLEFGAKKVTGIDLIETRVRVGMKKYPNLYLTQGDAANLPFKDGEFDLVMQFMCLSSVLSPIMRQKIANEMWRVLRPGGILLFYDLRPISRWAPPFLRLWQVIKGIRRLFRFQKKNRKDSSQSKPQTTSTHLMPLVEIKKLFNQGCVDVQSVSLDLKFASLAQRSNLMAVLLSHLSFLRTHYLALIQKPSY